MKKPLYMTFLTQIPVGFKLRDAQNTRGPDGLAGPMGVENLILKTYSKDIKGEL